MFPGRPISCNRVEAPRLYDGYDCERLRSVVLKHRHTRWTRRVLAGIVAGAIGLLPEASGWAASDPAVWTDLARSAHVDLTSAKRYYKDGQAKFRTGDFAAALADFQSANDIKATAQAQRYIARCLDALGQYSAAVEWYERFLAHVPPKMKAQGEQTRERVAEIRAGGGTAGSFPQPEGASGFAASASAGSGGHGAPSTEGVVDIDAIDVGKSKVLARPAVATAASTASTPSTGPTLNPPGGGGAFPGSGEASRPGSAGGADDGASETPLHPEASETAVHPGASGASETPPRAREQASLIPAFATAGASVAAIGVGTIFGIMALNDKARFDAHDTPQNAATRNEHALLSDIAFGNAFALGATSLVLFVMAASDHSQEPAGAIASSRWKGRSQKREFARRSPSVTPAPFVGPHAGGASVLVRF
jgi:hypothetical protein